jgi:hypothetical protein
MVNKRLRYNGFSFFARTVWTIESLDVGRTLSFPDIIERIDAVEFWTHELSKSMREWYRKKANEYMGTDKFRMEKHRHSMRKKTGGLLFKEDPKDWFNSDIMKPSGWALAMYNYTIFKTKEEESSKTKADVGVQTTLHTQTEEEEEEDDNHSYETQDSH